jgi:hypothetical protein
LSHSLHLTIGAFGHMAVDEGVHMWGDGTADRIEVACDALQEKTRRIAVNRGGGGPKMP